jgi:hypothetical protein
VLHYPASEFNRYGNKPLQKYAWSPRKLERPFRGIAADLAFLVPLWEGAGPAIDYVTGTSLTFDASGSWTTNKGGIGGTATANLICSAAYQPIVTSDGAGTGDFATLVVADPTSSANRREMLNQNNGTTTSIWMRVNADSSLGALAGSVAFATAAGGVSHGIAAASKVDGLVHCYAGKRSGSNLSLFVDGILAAGPTSVTVDNVLDASASLRIGGRGTSNNLTDRAYFACGWNRALTDDEMALVTDDPYGLLRLAGYRFLLATVASSTTYNQSVLASCSPVASLSRQVGKPLSATTSPAASLTRSTGKIVRASASAAASVTAIKVVLLSLQATASAVASMVRQTGKQVLASTAPQTSLTRAIAKALRATTSPVASLTRQTGKLLRASASAAASLATQLSHSTALAATRAYTVVLPTLRYTAKLARLTYTIMLGRE